VCVWREWWWARSITVGIALTPVIASTWLYLIRFDLQSATLGAQ
jgi:hypothetical protein